MLRKKENKEKDIYNQATLHVFHDNKIMSKLFNNGKIQITVLKRKSDSCIEKFN